MTENPFTRAEIVSWYRLKQSILEGSDISLVDIRERTTTDKPAACADFDGNNAIGRINGWVSGEFDFEAIRVSDGKDLLWRHVDAYSVQDLEGAYTDFIQTLSRGPQLPY